MTDIKAVAKQWFDFGVPVIPFNIFFDEKKGTYTKKNLGEWRDWQTEIQTEDEFNSLVE